MSGPDEARRKAEVDALKGAAFWIPQWVQNYGPLLPAQIREHPTCLPTLRALARDCQAALETVDGNAKEGG